MYSNCCCSYSFEPEIIKIAQSSHKMYSNNILNFRESTTILNACTKKVWKLIEGTTYICVSVCVCIYIYVCVFIYIYIYIYIYLYIYIIKKKTTKPITKDYKFISILLRIFEIFKNTKKN